MLNKLKKHVLIPVIRTSDYSDAEKIAHLLIETGIKVVEITMSVPESYKLIKNLKKTYPEIIAGAGTVLTVEDAKKMIAYNTDFIVSPVFDQDVINLCKENNILVIPGVLSPTEINLAVNCNLKAVKIFPASQIGGSKYIKAIKKIYPDLDFMPTGGVNKENLKEYLEAGSTLIGMGGNLVNLDLIKANKYNEIQDYAKEVMNIIKGQIND